MVDYFENADDEALNEPLAVSEIGFSQDLDVGPTSEIPDNTATEPFINEDDDMKELSIKANEDLIDDAQDQIMKESLDSDSYQIFGCTPDDPPDPDSGMDPLERSLDDEQTNPDDMSEEPDDEPKEDNEADGGQGSDRLPDSIEDEISEEDSNPDEEDDTIEKKALTQDEIRRLAAERYSGYSY